MIQVSFANDCDGLTWDEYRYVHALLDELGLPAGESFWLFSPDDFDTALFRRNTGEKTTNHDNLLEAIRQGRFDVLHGIGAFGRSPFYPGREEIDKAFAYLRDNGCPPIRVWTNHGNTNHVHNIGAGGDRYYQQGDLPFSRYHVLDTALKNGIEYFWISHNMRFSLDEPFRILREERTPSGRRIKTFTRYSPSWKTYASTLSATFARETLDRAVEMDQNLVFFTHWGAREPGASRQAPLLPRESLAALALLAEYRDKGAIRVVRLAELLEGEERKGLEGETHRVGVNCLRQRHAGLNPYYQVQFEPDRVRFFHESVEALGLCGGSLLDAGGGSGNFAFPASERFDSVVCMDSSEEALAAGRDIARGLQIENISFVRGDLEKMDFADESFDVVYARGVFHLVDKDRFLGEVRRVLKPGGIACITVNGDGFYQHAIKVKGLLERYGPILWNTFCRRLGGTAGVGELAADPAARAAVEAGDPAALFEAAAGRPGVVQADVLRALDPALKRYLGERALAFLAGRDRGVVETHRRTCHYPEEMEKEILGAGFRVYSWREGTGYLASGEHSVEIHEFDGLLGIWFAFAVK